VEQIKPITACIMEHETKNQTTALIWADDLKEVATSALWLCPEIGQISLTKGGITDASRIPSKLRNSFHVETAALRPERQGQEGLIDCQEGASLPRTASPIISEA